MNDSRACYSPNAAEPALTMVQESVDQGARLVTRSWMDHESCRFVDYQQGFIFMKDIERNGLRQSFGRPGLRHLDFNAFAGARRMGWFDGSAIDPDVTLCDEALDRAP